MTWEGLTLASDRGWFALFVSRVPAEERWQFQIASPEGDGCAITLGAEEVRSLLEYLHHDPQRGGGV